MSNASHLDIEDLVARPDQVRAMFLDLLGGMSARGCDLLA
jgi:hypothetical protein